MFARVEEGHGSVEIDDHKIPTRRRTVLQICLGPALLDQETPSEWLLCPLAHNRLKHRVIYDFVHSDGAACRAAQEPNAAFRKKQIAIRLKRIIRITNLFT